VVINKLLITITVVNKHCTITRRAILTIKSVFLTVKIWMVKYFISTHPFNQWLQEKITHTRVCVLIVN